MLSRHRAERLEPSDLAAARAHARLADPGVAARRARLAVAICRRALPVRDVPTGSAGRTASRSCSRIARHPAPAGVPRIRAADPARRRRDRRVGRDRRLPRRGRIWLVGRPDHLHQRRRRRLERHHERAAGALRPGAMVAASAFRSPASMRSSRSAAPRSSLVLATRKTGTMTDAPAADRPARRRAHRCCASTRPANMARPASMPASSPCCARIRPPPTPSPAWRGRRSATSSASTR